MYKVLKSDKDAYITNKYIGGIQAKSGNVGLAGTLDLFKLYGSTLLLSGVEKIPQIELSRALIHFDLLPLKNLFSEGKIDINDDSFRCHLWLKDVYGGEPTPSNFFLEVFPLSASFDEGLGKDTGYYGDIDKCNFISSSKDSAWYGEGCSIGCFSSDAGDYITSSLSMESTRVSQLFKVGDEDLLVDVTKIVSATLNKELPDSGFRISYDDSIESDKHTYFVKRFGTRHSYDESKRPRIVVRYDDSTQDDSLNLFVDSTSRIFLYNYEYEELKNLTSASLPVVGNDCLLLEMKTFLSGVGNYSLYFTGSQFSRGINFLTGVYSAEIYIPSTDSTIKSILDVSGSVTFSPMWKTLDSNVSFLTGSRLLVKQPDRTSVRSGKSRHIFSTSNINVEHGEEETINVRVNVFDENDPQVFAKKLPFVTPNLIFKNCFYGVRDSLTNEYVIPFDDVHGSTRLSSDAGGLYFQLDMSSLQASRSYIVDVLRVTGGNKIKYSNISPEFRVVKSQ
jgi:hypothetical protein